MESESFEEIECSTAREIFDRLSPLESLQKKSRSGNLIYRGQGNSEWFLIPKILRDEFKDRLKRWFPNQDLERHMQIFHELRMIQVFIEKCDEQGLKIPGDSLEFREYLKKFAIDNYILRKAPWPDIKFLPVMALAQHHGVPTRLLDWTSGSYIAAYFAVSKALELGLHKEEGAKIAVWALDIGQKGLFENVEIVQVPGSTSVNIASQRGCFTCCRHISRKDTDFGQPLEKYIGHHHSKDVLVKFTAPATEAKKILEYCDAFGVSATTLFPGYDGAAKSVHDSFAIWEKDDV